MRNCAFHQQQNSTGKVLDPGEVTMNLVYSLSPIIMDGDEYLNICLDKNSIFCLLAK